MYGNHLGERAGQRDHDLGPRIDLLLSQVGGRLHDRAHLHARDLGVEDRQADPAQAEHWVRLVQLLDAGHDLLELLQPRRILVRRLELGRLADQVLEAREELVQRRIDEPDDHRQPRHGLEDALEVAALDGQQLREELLAVLRLSRHDHALDDGQALLLHEHVLRAAQAHTLRAVLAGLDRVARVVGIRPHLQAAELVRPPQDGARGAVLVEGLGLDRRHGAQVHLAGRAVDGDLLALFDRLPAG